MIHPETKSSPAVNLWDQICHMLPECNGGIGIQLLLLFSCSVVSHSLQPHGLQYARLPCPTVSQGLLRCMSMSWSCHPTLYPFVALFSSRSQSFSACGSFQMSWFFISGGRNIGVSASESVIPMNIPGGFPLGLTGCISLQSKGLPRVFSSTTVLKHQFLSAQPSS